MGKRIAPSTILAPAITLVVAVVGTEAFVRLAGIPRWLLPPPSAVAMAAWGHGDALTTGFCVTAEAAAAGFVLAAIAGIVVGIILSTSRVVERAIYPYTVLFQTVPIVAIAPLLVLWFGPGLRAVTVSALVVAVFPVIANTLVGLRSVDPALVDMFRLYGAGRAAMLVKLKLPWALPSIFTGLRIASGLAVIGAIVGEFVAGFSEGHSGLGIVILEAYRQFATGLLFAAVLLASALGLVMFGMVNLAAWLVLRRWHASAQ